jgi:hypothetical protein
MFQASHLRDDGILFNLTLAADYMGITSLLILFSAKQDHRGD